MSISKIGISILIILILGVNACYAVDLNLTDDTLDDLNITNSTNENTNTSSNTNTNNNNTNTNTIATNTNSNTAVNNTTNTTSNTPSATVSTISSEPKFFEACRTDKNYTNKQALAQLLHFINDTLAR